MTNVEDNVEVTNILSDGEPNVEQDVEASYMEIFSEIDATEEGEHLKKIVEIEKRDELHGWGSIPEFDYSRRYK